MIERMDNTITLRPGILVSLRTTIEGGARYARRDIEDGYDGKSERKTWETTRTVDDVDDFERAKVARATAGGFIRSCCVRSRFGLICVADDLPKLNEAIDKAHDMAAEHNRTSASSRIVVNVIKGYIADSDEEAARAIAGEVRDLLDSMRLGIAGLDVKAIRKAANEARRIGSLLDESNNRKVSEAVKVARTAAREIVKRVDDTSEEFVKEIFAEASGPIESARIAFLDMEEHESTGEVLPAINTARVAGMEI